MTVKNFDAHSDIWTDITHHHLKGEHDNFRKYHYERLKKGNIDSGIFVIWNDPPYADADPYGRTHQMMAAIEDEEKYCGDILKVARSYKEMDQAQKDGLMATLIGLEGLKSIEEDLSRIDEFYAFGARHASLTWNEKNSLAAGAFIDEEYGITNLGKEAVRKIQSLGMIMDVSHLNRNSFWGVINEASGPIVATHSDCDALCKSRRSLTDDQLKAIAETGGVVGLNAFCEFVDTDQDKQDAEHLVNHLVHMVEIMGIDHVGFGFDFTDFCDPLSMGSFSNQDKLFTENIENASKVPEFVNLIRKKGFTEKELYKIQKGNWMRVICECLHE